MAKSNDLSRRDFLAHTAKIGAAGLAAPYFVSSSALGDDKKPGANDRIQIGVIGVNGQGAWNMGELLKQPDAQVVAVCDVFKDRREQAVAKCGGNAKGYSDFREVLARKDIDAVLIATPPHWHGLMAIMAAEAGKDFYLEKPMTLSLAESFAVLKAAEKNKRITQVGTQIHATKNYRQIVNMVRSGVIGPVSMARTFHVLNDGPEGIGNVPDTDPPAGVDWDLWLGPGPKRGYNALLAKDSSIHPSFMAYSGGWTPGMAPHLIDLPFWAMELDYPTSTFSSGGRYYVKDCGDAYDTHEVTWSFPKFTLMWTTSLINSFAFNLQFGEGCQRRRGIYFQGINGTIIADYGYLKVVPEGDRMKDAPTTQPIIPDSPGHHREWLDGIRSRTQPSCSVNYHHKLDVAINLSLISLKLGRSVQFDPATKKIVGDPEAAKLAMPTYRDPWKFPDEYMM